MAIPTELVPIAPSVFLPEASAAVATILFRLNQLIAQRQAASEEARTLRTLLDSELARLNEVETAKFAGLVEGVKERYQQALE